MSGGSDTTTTTTTVPEWIRPYAENFMGRAQQVSDLPYQGYSGQTTAQLTPYQTAALDATAARAMQGSPVTNAASEQLQSTLGGSYLGAGLPTNQFAGSNPHLGRMIDQSSADVVRNYQRAVAPQLDALDARSGSFGNSGVGEARVDAQRALTDRLGDISTGLRFQDYGLQSQLGENAANRSFTGYQNERNRMQGAVGMAPNIANQDYTDASQLYGAGATYQGQEQANLTDDYRRFTEARDYPRQQLDTMGRGLGMNFGSNTTATGPGANPLAQGLGGAMSAYGLYNTMQSGGGK